PLSVQSVSPLSQIGPSSSTSSKQSAHCLKSIDLSSSSACNHRLLRRDQTTQPLSDETSPCSTLLVAAGVSDQTTLFICYILIFRKVNLYYDYEDV
ncbi:unnamed protein product, partial [Ilex paraguariensis]